MCVVHAAAALLILGVSRHRSMCQLSEFEPSKAAATAWMVGSACMYRFSARILQVTFSAP